MVNFSLSVLALGLAGLFHVQDSGRTSSFQVTIMADGEETPAEDRSFVVLLGKNGTIYDLDGHQLEDEQLKLILFVAVGSPKGQCRVFLDVERETNTTVMAKALSRLQRQANPKTKTTVIVRL